MVERDDKGVSLSARFCVETRNLPKPESLNDNITENLEVMVDRSTLRFSNKRRFGA